MEYGQLAKSFEASALAVSTDAAAVFRLIAGLGVNGLDYMIAKACVVVGSGAAAVAGADLKLG